MGHQLGTEFALATSILRSAFLRGLVTLVNFMLILRAPVSTGGEADWAGEWSICPQIMIFRRSSAIRSWLFFAVYHESYSLGTVGDADGFGVGADLRIDYFLPGSPLEGWEGGYKTSPTGGATMFGSAPSLTSGTTVSVEDVSTDSVGGAIITSTYGSMEVKQELSFGRLISHCS